MFCDVMQSPLVCTSFLKAMNTNFLYILVYVSAFQGQGISYNIPTDLFHNSAKCSLADVEYSNYVKSHLNMESGDLGDISGTNAGFHVFKTASTTVNTWEVLAGYEAINTTNVNERYQAYGSNVEGHQVISVEAVTIQPFQRYNLALVKLKEKFHINSVVRPICISGDSQLNIFNDGCRGFVVSGYGPSEHVLSAFGIVNNPNSKLRVRKRKEFANSKFEINYGAYSDPKDTRRNNPDMYTTIFAMRSQDREYCHKDLNGNSVCDDQYGWSGSPVMSVFNNHWFLFGIWSTLPMSNKLLRLPLNYTWPIAMSPTFDWDTIKWLKSKKAMCEQYKTCKMELPQRDQSKTVLPTHGYDSRNPCQNGGTCNDQGGSSNKLSFHCDCPVDYAGGPTCTIRMKICQTMPCKNGGTCEALGNKFTCHCLPGYTGLACEEDINECASNPCYNDGICHNEVGKYKCECREQYSGKQCNIVCDYKAGIRYSPGGTRLPGASPRANIANVDACCALCHQISNCVGYEYYKPQYCWLQEKLGPKPEPCFGCISGIKNYDPCVSNPCKNGATCKNRLDKFICNCVIGWDGKVCDHSNAGIYIFGGDRKDNSKSVLKLNPKQNTVTAVGSIARYSSFTHAVTMKNGSIVILSANGGYGLYSTSDGSVTAINIEPDLSKYVLYQSVAIAGDILINCGRTFKMKNIPCLLYNTVTGGYTTFTYPKGTYGSGCMVTVNATSVLWIPDTNVIMFNVNTGQYKTIATMTGSRQRHRCSMHGSTTVVICGGMLMASRHYTSSCMALSLVTKKWSSFPAMKIERVDFGMVSWQGSMYAIGGSSNTDYHLFSIEYYHNSLKIWVKSTMTLPTGMNLFGVTAIG